MDADYQHFFIVRPVENADAAAFGQASHVAPQVIVIQFFGGRGFEGVDLATLRIHSRHHMFDDAILSGSIHGLKNQQQAPSVLGIEHVLEFSHACRTFYQQFLGMLFGMDLRGVARIMVFQPEFLTVLYPVGFGKLTGPTHFEAS